MEIYINYMSIERHKKLVGALNVIVNMTRCIASKRAMSAIDGDPELNFWRIQYGNSLDMAVIEWCKLFGSDDEVNQQIHWKNMFSDGDGFREGLFSNLELNQEVWNSYWKSMKGYRDQHVAHLDFKRRDVSNYPDLDLAVASADYYYGKVLVELRTMGESRFPEELGVYYESFLKQAKSIALSAIQSTRNFEETVG